MKNKHAGSSFDSLLEELGITADVATKVTTMTNRLIETKINKAIEDAQKHYDKTLAEIKATGVGRMTLLPESHPRVQHAHGYLNALADLRAELIAVGII